MAVITGTSGSDFLFGTQEDDQIDGGAGNDTLAGGNGNDTLLGGDGNDSLAGNAGADTLTGGAGNDRYSWRISPSFFAATDSTSLAQDVVTDFEGAGVAGGDTLELVESSSRRMVFEGALAAMPAIGGEVGFGGDGFTQVFYAFDGGDTIVFADSDDDGIFDADDFAVRLTGQHQLDASDFGATPFVIAGTAAGDTISGTAANDTIFGLGGNDVISGGTGDDLIDGGDGNDTLSGEAGNDRLIGGSGNDILMGGDGIDRITGDDGNDIIFGGAGRDTVLSGGDGNDVVFGEDGNDTLDGDDGNDLLFGGNGNDDLFGGDGNDMLFGEAGDDFVEGLDGNDIMFGGDGDDELIGDAGADIMGGGAGDDEFRFFLGSFNPSSPFARPDTVLDFEGAGADGGDEIRISETLVFRGEIFIDPKAGAVLPGGGNGLTDIAYAIDSGNTWLIADDDDDGLLDGADFAVRFVGTHRFTEQDFRSATFVTVGTEGDDTIVGTEGNDIIFGRGGNDVISGLEGDDEIDGGNGDDLLDGGPGFGFDNLRGGDGNDTLTLQNSGFGGNASGGAGNDILFGSDVSSSNFDNSLQGDAGDDDLHAGAVGSSMNGGSGADRLFSSASDDQMTGGRDELTFELDGAQDLFVYGGTSPWSSAGSFFGDILFDFEDGTDLFDMRGSGLTFADLVVTNDDFQTTIESARGTITLFENFGEPVEVTEADFLFV